MLSALLLWGMAVELLVWGAIGRAGLGWSWGATLALALGALLLGRALLLAVTWLVAWRHRSAAPPLSAGAWLVMLWREYWAFVGGFVLFQPWARLAMPADRLRPSAQPILLVHGYGCNRAIWWWLRPRLEAAGHVVATLSLEPPWGDIDGFAEQLQQRIEAVCAATGAPRLTLVAHSMGGLVSRACLARHGAARVAALISIASPHGGSRLAHLGLGRCARQMQPGSHWLARLAQQRVNVPFVSIRTPQDNFVMPQQLQRHADARDEPLPGVGHMAALCDERTLRLVLAHTKL
ncbi:MAG TPA: alpha/beta fold hydrolase [Ottowia sp.]|uniref:esterase/lipase family protein n=1 Tax=Ottowia sp. TaxID=1898956 RepID=UPI002BFE475D|nr:alpha/beta fold hydrolase [Ottowia sp.]MCZ2088933.1 alpha/beta fold hydrolase [Burkholderiales bacterium]HNE60789.1 alpha/beta fold hydrolase [Ottowia sp.]HNI86265.1 alpha/beta fold hydrolase [Ottowia sp.]HNJ45080.1 alpha/beta fold hydrolase [Ottowia sp.]HNL41493.1 alpha/beta fold hydrolase [Ottowia sp.]